MNDDQKISRKQILAGLIMLPAFAAVASTGARAAGSPKSAVKYQDKPKDGHDCKGCKFFKPGKTAKANGTCSVVTGSISPNGWCVAWNKK